MKQNKMIVVSILILMTIGCGRRDNVKYEDYMQTIQMTEKWDKVFPLSEKVNHKKVSFHNRFGITLAADCYTPKHIEDNADKLPAIAVCGPFGAVKEQSSGLYAMQMAERGYIAIAFDPSFTGESGGEPRQVASPDINTEDFSAAVDYLSTLKSVDTNRIGIIGICGWGGLALNAAALDPRIKATAAMTMYDMSKVTQEGYFALENTQQQRMQKRLALATQRTEDYARGNYMRAGGVVDPLPEDAPEFVKDYYAYYKTPRGYHERSGNSTDGWNITGCQSFLNTSLLTYADEIESAVLLVHGEKAHSRYFSEYAFEKITGIRPHISADGITAADKTDTAVSWSLKTANKELLIIQGASHVDLYDNPNKIPFDILEQFFSTYLQ